jgi:hypothetical protein
VPSVTNPIKGSNGSKLTFFTKNTHHLECCYIKEDGSGKFHHHVEVASKNIVKNVK